MKKRLVTALVVIGALALSACQDESMDGLIDETQLNQTANPMEEEDEVDIPGQEPGDKKEGYKKKG